MYMATLGRSDPMNHNFGGMNWDPIGPNHSVGGIVPSFRNLHWEKFIIYRYQKSATPTFQSNSTAAQLGTKQKTAPLLSDHAADRGNLWQVVVARSKA